MTRQEFDILSQRTHAAVWADREGITATLSGRNIETRTVNVPNGCLGIILSVQESSVTISWDHYSFENHRIQELLPNPIGVLEFSNLDMIRATKLPAGWSYI